MPAPFSDGWALKDKSSVGNIRFLLTFCALFRLVVPRRYASHKCVCTNQLASPSTITNTKNTTQTHTKQSFLKRDQKVFVFAQIKNPLRGNR
jgi:hypothetical protein